MPAGPDRAGRATAARVAAVVLAAGGSRRMGRPKQLLRVGGRTLVRRAAEAARDAGCSPVVVVLGAGAENVAAELAGLDIRTVLCANWHSGLSASVAAGVREIVGVPAVRAVLLLPCDLPSIGPEVLVRLIAAFDVGSEGSSGGSSEGSSGRRVGSAYAGVVGTPAIFERSLFELLLALSGDRGARDLLDGPETRSVPWPDGARDVDAPGSLPDG